MKSEPAIPISPVSNCRPSRTPIHTIFICGIGLKFVFDTTLDPNIVFDFGAGRVSEFEILGIASSVGLNPNSATDFVTTLTFEGSRYVHGVDDPGH